MARNSEKAMTTLARWRAAHLDKKEKSEARPYLATECDDLEKAEVFRRQIIGEVSKKVAQIQNAGLGEFKLRDLNDEINKLLREKRHWEDRIKDLGGPDYRRIGPKMLDQEGKEVPGNRGYRYFGATRDLPGVRELFEKPPPPPTKKSRAELMKEIDADYYGYRDEDDGVLVPLELKREKQLRKKLISTWKEGKEGGNNIGNIFSEGIESDEEETKESLREEEVPGLLPISTSHPSNFFSHVPVPSQKEIEEALVVRKKREILEKYASHALQLSETETKKLLGIS